MRLHAGEFLGSALRVHGWGGFTLTEYSYPAYTRLPNHEHQFAYLSFPLTGSYEERCGNTHARCSTTTAVFHPKGERHADVFEAAGARIFSVEIDDGWLERLRDSGALVNDRMELRDDALLRSAVKLQRMLACRERPPLLKIEACAIDLLAGLPSRPKETRVPRWLQTVLDHIRDVQPERPSTSALARMVGVHPVHLARTFRRVRGCTMSEHIRSLRIERAMQLLSGSDSLSEIAVAVGFYDQSHLCREFKRAVGVTPRQFRASR